MKYMILMSCGHEEERELFGSSAERKRKIQYFQRSGLCNACYNAAKESRERENLHGFLNPESFPAFTGSEKQIAWAEGIRKEAIVEVNANIKRLQRMNEKNSEIEKDMYAEDIAAYEEVGRQLSQVFNTITDAAQFIEKRYLIEPDALKALALKEKKKIMRGK